MASAEINKASVVSQADESNMKIVDIKVYNPHNPTATIDELNGTLYAESFHYRNGTLAITGEVPVTADPMQLSNNILSILWGPNSGYVPVEAKITYPDDTRTIKVDTTEGLFQKRWESAHKDQTFDPINFLSPTEVQLYKEKFVLSEGDNKALIRQIRDDKRLKLKTSKEVIESIAKIVAQETPSVPVQFRGKVDVKDYQAALEWAIDNSNIVVFSYYSATKQEPTTRRVSPLKIVGGFENGPLMEGYCHKRRAIRHFSLERMSALLVSNKTFSKGTEFYVGESVEVLETSGGQLEMGDTAADTRFASVYS